MNKGEAVELVKASDYDVPFDVWEYTALDRVCLRMVIRGTWIFDTRLDIDLLKSALSKTLGCYPHLAGRMVNQRGITVTNDGVPFGTADEPQLSVKDILKRDDFTNIRAFSVAVNPARLSKGLAAPLSVKVTHLRDGSVLGVQCSHVCMDGDSFYTLAYKWGQICRAEPFDKPVLDQSLLPVPEDMPAADVKAAAIKLGWKQLSIFSFIKLLPAALSGVLGKRSRPFHIPAETINRLKAQLLNSDGTPYSSNVILSALITKRLMDLYKHEASARCSAVTVVNARKRLAAIPATYAGNSSLAVATPGFPAETGIKEIARTIDQVLEPVRQIPSPELTKLMQLNLNAIKQKLPFAPFDVLGMYAKKPTITYLNNFSKLRIYDLDFGSGRPIRVIPHDLRDQVVIWPAPPAVGGVELYFSGIPYRYVNQLKSDYFDLTT